MIAASVSVSDTAAIATLITVTIGSVGGFVLGYLKLRKVHKQVNAVNGKVDEVQESLRLPSEPEKSIAAEMEGISQSFHFMSRLFVDHLKDLGKEKK